MAKWIPYYTFRVHATGTSGELEYYILPPEQVVCIGEDASFTAYKTPNTPETSDWSLDGVAKPPSSSIELSNEP